MTTSLAIPRAPEADPALDQRRLFALGMDQVRAMSRNTWNDHNTHDPGITILELSSYGLTELAHRCEFSIPDLLADEDPAKNALVMQGQFYRPREILTCRPLTNGDYRRILIDMEGVRNAWIRPADVRYDLDLVVGELIAPGSGKPGLRPVALEGLYRVLLELEDGVKNPNAVRAGAMALLQKNRNLCEDFVSVDFVRYTDYALCAEIELDSDADPVEVAARIEFDVSRYLAPRVVNYTLDEMRAMGWSVPQIFEGPPLDHGFIPDDELEAAELRTEIRLSDVIAVIMDIEGVRAVRDIVMNEVKAGPPAYTVAPADKWRMKVPEDTEPRLSKAFGKIRLTKRDLPVLADPALVQARWDELEKSARAKDESKKAEDIELERGRFRGLRDYYSFQNHFPAIYGLSQAGLDPRSDPRRRALALQLKGYLLFFDQVMANFLASLALVRELYSRDPSVKQTYHAQAVTSFRDAAHVYAYPGPIDDAALQAKLQAQLETDEEALARRNRFLDHLLSRVAEDFRHYVDIMRSAFGTNDAAAELAKAIGLKCKFLADCPSLGAERSLAYDYTKAADLWNSANVSGLERRIAHLLDIADITRRDLGVNPRTEGMYLIENILLRPGGKADPFLPVCVDPSCTECVDDDPYSYRLHIVLPADVGRFQNMDFRRFVEETIRMEMPAHIVPKICWAGPDDIAKLAKAYQAWLPVRAGQPFADAAARLKALIDALFAVKSVYPSHELRPCGDAAPFVLGSTALGTEKQPDP